MSPNSPRASSPAATQRSSQKRLKVEKHLCDRCDPPKSSAFSTTNDLIRHKRTVHGICEPGEKIWRCNVEGCAWSSKIWPRRDNFSSHLKRMHFNGDDAKVKEVVDTFQESYDPVRHGPLENTERRGNARSKHAPSISPSMEPPAIVSFPTGSLPGQSFMPNYNTQQFGHFNRYSDNVTTPMSRAPRPTFSAYGNNMTPRSTFRSDFVDPALLMAPPSSQGLQRNMRRRGGAFTAPPNADTFSRQKREMEEQDQADGQFSNSYAKPSLEDLSYFGQGVVQEIPVTVGPSSDPSEQPTIDLDASIDNTKKSLEELKTFFAALSPEARKLFRSSSSETLARLMGKTDPNNEPNNLENDRTRSVSKLTSKKPKADDKKTLKCDFPLQPKGDKSGAWIRCNAPFSSSVELRKHKKRHDKRFGCTFDNCYSKFGTKWEWKRHEHSKHFQMEAWRCCYTNGNQTCHELFDKKIDFKQHLAHHFGRADKALIDKEVLKGHLARKWLGSFWCGHCRSVQMSNAEYGRNMDEERIDHIGEHVLKGYKSLDWVELGGKGKTKGQMQKEEEERTQKLQTESETSAQSSPSEAAGEDEDQDNGDIDRQPEPTSPSDTDSADLPDQPPAKPPLHVSTQDGSIQPTAGGHQIMSAPPAINADGSARMITGQAFHDMDNRSVFSANYFRMPASVYQQQRQQQQQSQQHSRSQPLQPPRTTRQRICSTCGNPVFAVYNNGSQQFVCDNPECLNYVYTVSQAEYLQGNFPSSGATEFSGF